MTRSKTDRIKMIRSNLDEGYDKYKNGQVSHEQWKRMKKDASGRIAELKADRKAENK